MKYQRNNGKTLQTVYRKKRGFVMKLGSNFWIILRIITAVFKALVAVLGDDDDKTEANNNGF